VPTPLLSGCNLSVILLTPVWAHNHHTSFSCVCVCVCIRFPACAPPTPSRRRLPVFAWHMGGPAVRAYNAACSVLPSAGG
jgi:hypothetical protein